MAEVFGVVSAGIGVAAAAGQLFDGIMKLHDFCSQIRNIPEDIQTAVDELSVMAEVLEFIQIEIGHETLPHQPSTRSSFGKVLSNLQQSSQQVEEVLEEMRTKLGKNRYWGRIKAVGMTKKLERAAKRVENAQRMVLILLAAENRMTFRQGFNSQGRELTAISARIVSISNIGQSIIKAGDDAHAINSTESSITIDADPSTAESALFRPTQRTFKTKGRNTASFKLRLPNSFLNSVWEFSVYKSNQGWDSSLRSYIVRPWDAQIFSAARNGDLPQVRELLRSGRASIWDRDPYGWGVLHFAACSCADHGSSVVEYLVKSGADIYSVNNLGIPPHHYFHRDPLKYLDEQQDRHLIAGYKAFTSHRDWISSNPSLKIKYDSEAPSDVVEMFPMYQNPPEEMIRSILHEMWPPWEDMSSADRIRTLLPKLNSKWYTTATNPLCVRAFFSREYIQESFANWEISDKVTLIEWVFQALAVQLALGSDKGIKEARLFLEDMHTTNSLIDTLLETDFLQDFANTYALKRLHQWERVSGCERSIGKDMNAAQEGLKRYVSELLRLGIDITTLIEIDRKEARRVKEDGFERWLGDSRPGYYKIIAIDYGLEADDWYLWLSTPLDEWAGEFWDMIDHPERGIPGAWTED